MADRYILPAGFAAFALNAIAKWRRTNPPTRSGGYGVTDYFSNDSRGAWGVRLDYIRAGAAYDFAVFAVWYHPDTNRFAPADLAFRIDTLTTEGDIAATLNRTLDHLAAVLPVAAQTARAAGRVTP